MAAACPLCGSEIHDQACALRLLPGWRKPWPRQRNGNGGPVSEDYPQPFLAPAVEPGPRLPVAARRERAAQLRASGLQYREIAAQLGCSAHYAWVLANRRR